MTLHEHPYSYTNAVMREQYEAALAAKNDGWIEWDGGERPVAMWSVVDFKMRSGEMSTRYANVIRWDHKGIQGDIIAYRLHQMQEAELNECIGQDAALVWSGEGLPPVGCECESKQFAQIDWHNFRVVAVENGHVFGFWNDKVGVCLDSTHWEFRPIRTEAERAIDEMVRLSGVSIGAAKILYDAGYRKG
jgi:hypothetical protein